MIPVRTVNDDHWLIPDASAKMGIVGGYLDLIPLDIWRAALGSQEQSGMVDLLMRMHEQSDKRMRDLTAQVGSLDGHIKLLNANLERYAKLPERLERVERFVWAGSLIAAFIGVILGGVGQRVLSEAVISQKQEEHLHDERVRPQPAVHQGA